MPLLTRWTHDGAVFGIWTVTETAEELHSALCMLPEEEAEWQSLKAESRRLEFLAVRVLLGVLCGEKKQIAHRASGKPYLSDGSFRISISHTKGYAAIALHPTAEVGIDIEYLSQRVCRVTEKFLSEAEQSWKETEPERETVRCLLCWSAKETAYKILDNPATDFKEHLSISLFRVQDTGDFALRQCSVFPPSSLSLHYCVGEGFVCTWCVA